MARSDLLKFWKLLSDARFTGSPSKLTEDDVRKMANTVGLPQYEIEAVLRGLREFLSLGDEKASSDRRPGRSGTGEMR
jgi:hypothetical protein